MHEWTEDWSSAKRRGSRRGRRGRLSPLGVTMQSVQILKFTDGLASDWWGTADVFGVLRQVGASVAPPA